MSKRSYLIAACAVVGVIAAGLSMRRQARTAQPAGTQTSGNVVVKRQDFIRSVRLSGTVEAVEATTIADAAARRARTTTRSSS